MNKKMNSPSKLKQTKITAFCLAIENSGENLSSVITRKRKNEGDISEVHKTPIKKAARTDSRSPILFQNPELFKDACKREAIKIEAKSDIENFEFDDFENDFFLSPTRKESHKKNILTESLSENEAWEDEKSEINFETPVKCKVTQVKFLTKRNFEQILRLSDLKSKKTGVCRLRDVWTSFSFSPHDLVCIRATFSDGVWLVNNKNGYVILDPDILISSTTLSGLMFCMRKGFLSEIFKEVYSETCNKMAVGRLVHEFFQESLKTRPSTNDDFYNIIEKLTESRENFRNFFFSGMSVLDIQKEMKNFIPPIRNFLNTYMNKEIAPTGNNYKGTIEEVIDIEELIKSPELGLQGRIDVTVKLKSKNVEKIAPLELKTGRASFSKEHRSQLTMYILLMKELGRSVDSGLLLYLREDSMEEVLPERDEIRNLFLLRNHFVGFSRKFVTGNLPEPIRSIRGCTKCPYFRVCTTYLKGEEQSRLSQTHPLRGVEIPDLKASHVDYFLKWSKMLWWEFEDSFEDARDGFEVSQLRLEPNVESFKKEYKCAFRKTAESKNSVFRSGVFVNVNNGKNNRVCSGKVVEVTDSFIYVLTDKKLNDFSDSYTLNILKAKHLNFYFSNLGWFLDKNFEALRELIIDKKTPNFDKSFDRADFQEKCLKFLLDLNKEQQKAVLKSLLCQDYLLIKGPPGTGKTQTIVTLVKVLLALNKTVLIASHTHSAVDNILLKLDGVDFLRLGSLKRIHEDIHKNSLSYLIENCSSVDDFKSFFDRKLFASTCMGIDSDFVRFIKVDYCIVDESTQVLQPEILRPLFCSKKFILVGDEDQLTPVVRNVEAKKQGMSESMFEWLSSDHATVKLRKQYRMNSVINSLANGITYNGLIECGNESVAKATMKIPNHEMYLREDEWIVDVLSNKLEKSVVFIDTSEYFRLNAKKSNEQRCSLLEANIVIKLVTCLVRFGLKEENLGVITPFWDQIALLEKKLEKENLHKIELNTVDQYQGRDKEVVLLSCTKENQGDRDVTEQELLNNERRLTVAVTRAKYKLIIVGDKRTVSKYKPFQKLIQSMSEDQFFILSSGQKQFFWENFEN